VNWVVTDWYRPEQYYKSSSWHATWDKDGGGVLLNQCPHNLDLLQWICGNPVRVQGFCHEGRFHDIEVEDDVTAYLEWENGATGTFITSTGDAPGINRLEISLEEALIVCENGNIRIGELAQEIKVIRNDAMTVDEIAALKPSHIILSPGPGRPEDAGVIIETVQRLGGEIPILGVCLGHQAICAAYGAPIIHAKQLMHGKQSEVTVQQDCPLFSGMPQRVKVARYHSLAADPATLPECLKVTAMTEEGPLPLEGEVMAVQHTQYPTFGVQFHPESILTPDGKQMLRSFIEI
jgi:anthranilate synthase/aminodeoxychorismate synthase-like glutamine amidotransferase